MFFKWTARIVLIAGYAAICIYAVVAETGPIGWINYAQQSVLGSYSQKLTMLIALIASMAVLGPLWLAIDWVGRKMGVSDANRDVMGRHEPPKQLTWKAALMSSLVAVPLIWIGAYAIYWYYQHQDQTDAAASYEPVRLVRGEAAPAASGAYLAVGGRLLWERTVALTKGSSKTVEYTLVPLVAEGWRDGDPVPFIVKVDPGNRYAAEQATRGREAVLGHAEGAIAVPAAQEFGKMQVPVGDATRHLRLVPSEGGVPHIRDTALRDWDYFLYGASGGSVFYVFMTLVVIAALANQKRKDRKAALRAQAAPGATRR